MGDTVRVLTGKDKGKEGKITKVLRSEGKVVVEGLNIVIKHQKPRAAGAPAAAGSTPQGGRIEQSMPFHIAKVQLVDPADGKTATRVGIRTNESGERVRFAKKSGGVITNGE
ncbi:MAG: 50S ribosomal protein L24 [Janthinobacterium lividum]